MWMFIVILCVQNTCFTDGAVKDIIKVRTWAMHPLIVVSQKIIKNILKSNHQTSEVSRNQKRIHHHFANWGVTVIISVGVGSHILGRVITCQRSNVTDQNSDKYAIGIQHTFFIINKPFFIKRITFYFNGVLQIKLDNSK